jgi:hypothetical protein
MKSPFLVKNLARTENKLASLPDFSQQAEAAYASTQAFDNIQILLSPDPCQLPGYSKRPYAPPFSK